MTQSPSCLLHLSLFTVCVCVQPGTVLIMKGQEDVGRDQPLSRVIHPPHPPPPASKARFDGGNARRTSPSTGNKATAGQEGEFPCKKCGRSVITNIPSVTAVVLETSALFTYAKQQLHKWPQAELSYIKTLNFNRKHCGCYCPLGIRIGK